MIYDLQKLVAAILLDTNHSLSASAAHLLHTKHIIIIITVAAAEAHDSILHTKTLNNAQQTQVQ